MTQTINFFYFLLNLFFVIYYIIPCLCADFRDFDESIKYQLNWLEASAIEKVDPGEVSEFFVITSKEKDRFNCSAPVLKKRKKATEEPYEGPNALELIQPLFQSSCFSRIESYWTYEICHGKYIRQYHELKEGKKIKLQEYYMGRWDKLMTTQLNLELEKAKAENTPPPTKKIDGIAVPYLELNFTDGTVCELIGEPRHTTVHYMCLNNTKSDILSVLELSTCVYQVNVFTQLICKHPKYRPEESWHHNINCYPMNGGPAKPKSIMLQEVEKQKKKHLKPPGAKNDKLLALYTINDQDGRTKVRLELHKIDDSIDEDLTRFREKKEGVATPVEDESTEEEHVQHRSAQPQQPPQQPLPVDLPIPFPTQEFLSGKYCLRGGSGWWKYKFCYGKTVEQYHIDKRRDGSVEMTSITLGIFNKAAHLDWIKANPHKRPKPIETRTSFSQYYTGGDICEKTGQPRVTEVRLKCVDKKGTVSLYLLEPQVCQYILGVESPLICDVLDRVDDTGLIDRSLSPSYTDTLLNLP